MPNSSFLLNAWVVGGRHRHHRTRDHFGADSDLYVGLSEAIGPWPPGTPIAYVLADLYDRQATLASYDHHIRVFYLDANVLALGATSGSAPGTLRSILSLDAVVKKARSSSFTLNAYVIHGGSFTLDAYVRGYGSFFLDAYVV